MSSLAYDLVGFDLDGTLVDSAVDLAHATNHALALAGRGPLAVAEVARFVGRGPRVMLARALEATGGDDGTLLDRLFPALLDHYAAHIADHSRPYPGVEAALDALAGAGLRLAICTNKRERLTHLLVAALGWQGRFAAIVGGDTAGALKPDPAPLAAMVARAGGGRALFVGDSAADTGAARALGVPCLLFVSGYGEAGDPRHKAKAVFRHFDDLPGLVLGR